MKNWNKLFIIACLVLLSVIMPSLHQVKADTFSNLKGISADKYEPTGDSNVSYPQIAIRTNRTAERTDFQEVIDVANEAADQYPIDEPEMRAKAVMEKLTQWFGSGSFGHAWIIIFNSSKKGDYTSYGYHEGYGFVKNGTASDQNDSPERKFHLERVVPLTKTTPAQLEATVIPELNKASAFMAETMGIPVKDPEKGAYTPINNCSWFAGNLWNSATGEKMIFEQAFNGADHADYWGMPFLSLIKAIADPGMIAESIRK